MTPYWKRKIIDLELYKTEEILLRTFRLYGCVMQPVGRRELSAYMCLSPFNKERTPSCRIQSIRKGRNGKPVWGFKCFSSGAAGDVFALVMKKQAVDFWTAMWIVTKRIAADYNPGYSSDPNQIHLIFPAYEADPPLPEDPRFPF